MASLGLTRISGDEVPDDAVQAVPPDAQGGINGVVQDFKPGGGTPGEVEAEEVGPRRDGRAEKRRRGRSR